MEKVDSNVQKLADDFQFREVCANIREQGSEYRPKISGKCTEYYVRSEAGKWAASFSCKSFFTGDFNGKFDGPFNRSVVGDNFDDNAQSKDSMVVEVGYCSRIM